MPIKHYRYAHFIGVAIMLLMFGKPSAFAAFAPPIERFHVPLPELPLAVAQETIGVFDLLLNGNLHRGFMDDDTSNDNRNVAGKWDGYTQIFQPNVDRIAIYDMLGSNFSPAGFLLLHDVLPVSSILFPYDIAQLLRFPVVEVKGDYRRIVYDSRQDLRTWIKFTDHANPKWDIHSFNTYSGSEDLDMLYLEMSFSNDSEISRERWRPDMFYLTPDETRKIYQSPDENAPFEIVTPASKISHGDWRGGEAYQSMLRFTQIQHGFAEVFIDRYPQAGSVPLGWIKLKEHGYQNYWDYYPFGRLPTTCGRSSYPSVHLPFTDKKRHDLYALPDRHAASQEFERDLLKGLFMIDLHDGFVLLGEVDGFYEAVPEDDICADEGCGSPCNIIIPLGWIPIRDKQQRLILWPSIPGGWNCTC